MTTLINIKPPLEMYNGIFAALFGYSARHYGCGDDLRTDANNTIYCTHNCSGCKLPLIEEHFKKSVAIMVANNLTAFDALSKQVYQKELRRQRLNKYLLGLTG